MEPTSLIVPTSTVLIVFCRLICILGSTLCFVHMFFFGSQAAKPLIVFFATHMCNVKLFALYLAALTACTYIVLVLIVTDVAVQWLTSVFFLIDIILSIIIEIN